MKNAESLSFIKSRYVDLSGTRGDILKLADGRVIVIDGRRLAVYDDLKSFFQGKRMRKSLSLLIGE